MNLLALVVSEIFKKKKKLITADADMEHYAKRLPWHFVKKKKIEISHINKFNDIKKQ